MPRASSSVQEYRRYLFDYRHENADWCIEIVASSPEDAQKRLKALAWAQYQGEVHTTMHIPTTGILGRIRRWWDIIS